MSTNGKDPQGTQTSGITQAQAAMTAPPPGDNMEIQRQGFFKECETFGSAAGAGDTSKVGWFQSLCTAGWAGHITPHTKRRKKEDLDKPTDAEMAFDIFAEARKRKAGEMGKRLAGKTAGDRPQRVAEANRMIALGALPQIHAVGTGGLGVFNKTLRIIKENDDILGEVDDLLLLVARRQCEKPDVPFTDDQIKAILRPDTGSDDEAEKKATAEVELWGNVLRQIESIMNTKYPSSASSTHAKDAKANVVKRIDALGGTKAMVRAREKVEQEKRDKQAVARQGANKGKAKRNGSK